MKLDDRQVFEVCQDLWQVVLGLNLASLENPTEREPEQSAASYVNISGDWQGAVMLQCTESVTRHAAAMLFEVDADNVTDSEHQDALNELTRMLAKRIQRACPVTCKVSTARPIKNGELPASLTTMQDVSRLELTCEGRPVRVSLLEAVRDAAETASA